MRNKKPFILILILFVCIFSGCKKEQKTSVKNKIIYVTADNSLQPVMEEMMEVFSYKYPNHKIKITYKTESLCEKDLSNPSIDLVINFKPLDEKEKESFYKQKKFYFTTNVLAFDAILIISNKKTPLKEIRLEEISRLLLKKIYKNQTILMDGYSATSTYNYLSREFLKGESFSQNIQGAENIKETINFIAKYPNNIGFISSLWLNNLPNRKKDLVLASVEKIKESNLFIYPNKENILSSQYPIVRPIVFILKHNYETQANWLVSFMQQEKGQLIFKRNGAIPSNKNINIRKIKIDF